MNKQQFEQKTKELALRIIKLVQALPKTTTAQIIGKQILHSATSVGANYRAACRAKSTADLLDKLAIVEEKADETLYWLELLLSAEIIPQEKLERLINFTNEIVAMIVASIENISENKNSFNPK